MTERMIRQVWLNSYADFQSSGYFQSDVQRKASQAILDCKSGKPGGGIFPDVLIAGISKFTIIPATTATAPTEFERITFRAV